jgi:ABC-2 type transport system permease protein
MSEPSHEQRTEYRFNSYGVWAIYKFEMARFLRTAWQSILTPVITTSLYFVVFGSAIGSRMAEVGGVPTAPSSCPA